MFALKNFVAPLKTSFVAAALSAGETQITEQEPRLAQGVLDEVMNLAFLAAYGAAVVNVLLSV